MYYVDRLGPENASAIRNSEVTAIGNVLLYYGNGVSIGTARYGRVSEVAPIGRWSLVEVPLYTQCLTHV